ncbi:hypothetical protein K9N08_00995 [Candidatus Gracilibacteria bacterium]|nr:hypothetical protein [Candidatus Gracilibacteria bacterium]MCF7856120.1 hypothetical protein [Candidatus Gracilibacteria bacterium]MCF7896539.1 hypothetical protein [Candidatus Gracilibacteria bacterium]
MELFLNKNGPKIGEIPSSAIETKSPTTPLEEKNTMEPTKNTIIYITTTILF